MKYIFSISQFGKHKPSVDALYCDTQSCKLSTVSAYKQYSSLAKNISTDFPPIPLSVYNSWNVSRANKKRKGRRIKIKCDFSALIEGYNCKQVTLYIWEVYTSFVLTALLIVVRGIKHTPSLQHGCIFVLLYGTCKWIDSRPDRTSSSSTNASILDKTAVLLAEFVVLILHVPLCREKLRLTWWILAKNGRYVTKIDVNSKETHGLKWSWVMSSKSKRHTFTNNQKWFYLLLCLTLCWMQVTFYVVLRCNTN